MRHARARGVVGCALVAALAATIVAAPVASAKKATPERSNLVKAVGTASVQAKKLISASRSCPAAARQRTITSQVRTAQTKRLARAGATSLRLRQLRISTHTRRLAVALTRCSSAPAASQPGGPGTRVLQPTNGSNGANGSNGSNGSDGVRSAQLPLDALGALLDVGGLLDGGVLPGSIPAVDIGSLGVDPACIVAGSACVGVDGGALTTALTDTVRAQIQQLPLLAGVLDPLLAQVQATLAATGPGSLVTVERTGDSTLVVTARAGTALASLLNVLGTTGVLPATPFATVQIR